MNTSDVLKIVDHTLLTQTATWAEIKEILDDAMKFGTASACIPAAYVKQAAEYVDGKLPICTVIGFPNGYSTTATKVLRQRTPLQTEPERSIWVINIGFLKDGRYDEVENEICQIHEALQWKDPESHYRDLLLTRKRKLKLCEIVTQVRSRIYQDFHRFLQSRSNLRGCEAHERACGEGVKVKSSRRHLFHLLTQKSSCALAQTAWEPAVS